MNRVGLGLAVGAGYLLGRTKKLKVALAVGTAVAGKRMNLTPRGIADLVSAQLRNNPQFKEIGDQLRQDMRGVGKAAAGALVERQVNGLADRLHGRTSQVRDQLSGAASRAPGAGADDDRGDEYDDADEGAPAPAKKAAAKKVAAKKVAAKKAAAKKAPAKKAPARRTAATKSAAKRTQPATKPARGAARGTRARLPKGGGER